MKRSSHHRAPIWVIIVVAGLTVMFVANALFIYIAVRGADPVVSSYDAEHR